jgi:hypothetical protein
MINLKTFCIFVIMKKEEIKINGLSLRHVAQIVRRKMIQKSVPSKKVYNRKDKFKLTEC